MNLNHFLEILLYMFCIWNFGCHYNYKRSKNASITLVHKESKRVKMIHQANKTLLIKKTTNYENLSNVPQVQPTKRASYTEKQTISSSNKKLTLNM